MIPVTIQRLDPRDLANHEMIIVRGINEKFPALCAIGWVDEAGPHPTDEAALINEPMFFVNTTPPGSHDLQLSFLTLQGEVPLEAEFFEYNRLEKIAGNSITAREYIARLLEARNFYRSALSRFVPLNEIYKIK